MSLVIGFSGASGAVIGGDMREILFLGRDSSVAILEQELYSGIITSDWQLKQRAVDLDVALSIRDDKVKIREEERVLVGEVTESDAGVLKRRRLYLVPGEYAIADIIGGQFRLISRAGRSSFIVLGNEVTKKIANDAISKTWEDGTFEGAVKTIVTAMETAASRTASVSKECLILQTKSRGDLSDILERDRQQTGKAKKKEPPH
jgi:hypothetical protein